MPRTLGVSSIKDHGLDSLIPFHTTPLLTLALDPEPRERLNLRSELLRCISSIGTVPYSSLV